MTYKLVADLNVWSPGFRRGDEVEVVDEDLGFVRIKSKAGYFANTTVDLLEKVETACIPRAALTAQQVTALAREFYGSQTGDTEKFDTSFYRELWVRLTQNCLREAGITFTEVRDE